MWNNRAGPAAVLPHASEPEPQADEENGTEVDAPEIVVTIEVVQLGEVLQGAAAHEQRSSTFVSVQRAGEQCCPLAPLGRRSAVLCVWFSCVLTSQFIPYTPLMICSGVTMTLTTVRMYSVSLA